MAMGFFDFIFGGEKKKKPAPLKSKPQGDRQQGRTESPRNENMEFKRRLIDIDAPDFDVNVELPPVSSTIADFIAWDPWYKRRVFGEIAISLGFITVDDLHTLLSEQSKTKERIGVVALNLGLLTSEQVDKCLLGQKIVVFVDRRQSANHEVMTWISDCKKKLDRHVKVVWSEQKEISHLREEINEKKKASSDESVGLETLNNALVLFQECAAFRGSDIHILVRENFTEIQLRVKGELKTIQTMTKNDGENLIRAIYTGLSSVKEAMFNPYEYQDAQISGDSIPGSGLTSVRVIRGPCYPVESGGQFLIARLQYGQKKASTLKPTLEKKEPAKPPGKLKLSEYGYTKKQIQLLEKMTRMPSGIILITGPTGSGKTSTLYELMMQQARIYPSSRHITVENPVEYPMSWAIQMPIVGAKNDKESGDKYLNAVRMTLRMDPDIILLGELRGADEAKAAVQEAMTGHLVWSTIHVIDPYMSVDRLEQLDRIGLHRSIICDHKLLRGLVAQRLVKVLCPACKKPATSEDFPDAEMYKNIMAWNDYLIARGLKEPGAPRLFVRGDGCDHCHNDKIMGSTAVAEVVITTPELMRVIIHEGTDAGRRYHRGLPDSDMSMLGNAMLRLCAGEFDPYDVENAIDIIEHPDKE